jgi:hypothetical protein
MSVLQGSVYPAVLGSVSDLTAATVTCTVTAPDGSSPAVTVVKGLSDPKTATANVLATQVGTYLIVWGVTGLVTGAEQDQFTVVAPTLDLMSLPDLKDRLNMKATDSSKDAKLRGWLRAATEVVENITGPILPRTVVESFAGGQNTIVLSAEHVLAITSVTETYGPTSHLLTEQPLGASVDAYGYTWDRSTGVLTRRSAGGSLSSFAGGPGAITVTYRAGLSQISEDVQLAAAELISHWYRKQNVAYRAPSPYGPGEDDGAVMVGNYMVPNAVMELLEPLRRMPSIA